MYVNTCNFIKLGLYLGQKADYRPLFRPENGKSIRAKNSICKQSQNGEIRENSFVTLVKSRKILNWNKKYGNYYQILFMSLLIFL